jgi:hypothetical protein
MKKIEEGRLPTIFSCLEIDHENTAGSSGTTTALCSWSNAVLASKNSELVCILSERRFEVEVERFFVAGTETLRELVNMYYTQD